MKKSVMQKWVKALRSGKYNQTKRMLNNGYGGYCCLGVLCDISEAGEWVKDLSGVMSYSCSAKSFATSVLPKKVMKWSGIQTMDGQLSKTLFLTQINDEGNDFHRIADIIEKNYKKL